MSIGISVFSRMKARQKSAHSKHSAFIFFK
jgi:hypothetical protein